MYQRTKQGAVDVIAGEAPLNHEHVEAVESLLWECVAGGQPMTVIDLSRTSLIDSAGLELLVDAGRDFHRRGGALKLAAPNPLCRDILRISGVDEQLEVYSHKSSAVGSFSR